HIGFADAETLKAWVGDGGAGHTATISGTVFDQAASFGDVMAGFSSRGPNKPAPDIIKPDVTAPGVDILAAYSTPTEFNVISGTSMSSPHSAGAAALVRAVHPAWTPAEVQSALTSTGVTASVRKDDGTTAADPFDMGGGRIDLTRGARAGLVLDETRADYDAANPAAGGDPATLNLATLGQGDCRGKCSWNRTAENVSGSTVTWHVQVDAPSGLQLSVKPSQFTLAPGQTVGLHVTADVKNLPGLRWVFAQVRLVPNVQGLAEQHLPVAVQPVAAERVDIEAMNTSGTHTIQVTTPVNIRRFSATVSGLREGAATSETVVQDPTPLDPYDTVDPAIGTFFVLAEAPAGSRVLATEITATTSLDLDLYVGLDSNGNRRPDAGEEVCASASETAFESCSLTEPATGTYWVLVQNFLTGRVVDDVQLVTAVVPGTNNGNLTVTGPAGRVATGTTFDVSLRWNEPAMEVGDVWFALVQMASDRNHVGNVASKLVAITRTE
ncbi:MAG: S8 family serine peptidase, partial [Acidimicrobiales bacterium]